MAALPDQPGASQARQGIVQPRRRHRRDGTDHLVGEAPAEGRADLSQFACLTQAIQPGKQ